MTIPLVDARSGEVVHVGDFVDDGLEIVSVEQLGPLSVLLTTQRRGYFKQSTVVPIKYWPRLLYYGPEFPDVGWRVVVLPT